MKTRFVAALTLAGSSVLLLSACSSAGSAGGMSGMDHSATPMPASSSSSSAASASVHNAEDVSFAQGMAMHHLQAIEMSDVLLDKQGIDAKVTSLATDIKAAQDPEIAQMNAWLKSWGEMEVSTSSMTGMDHDMGSMGGGMMSKSDMDALRAASGAKAATLFLTQMTEHHRGAVEMARTEVSQGQNADAIALAKKIIADQTAQITQMQDLLKQG